MTFLLRCTWNRKYLLWLASSQIKMWEKRSESATRIRNSWVSSSIPGTSALSIAEWEEQIRWFPDCLPALIFDSAVKKLNHNPIVSYLELCLQYFQLFKVAFNFLFKFSLQSISEGRVCIYKEVRSSIKPVTGLSKYEIWNILYSILLQF